MQSRADDAMNEKNFEQPSTVQDVGNESDLNEQDKDVMAQMGKKQVLPVRLQHHLFCCSPE